MRPEDFPIGSPESRAAARMLAQHIYDSRERVEVVFVGICRHRTEDGKPYASPWIETSDGKLFRTIFTGDMSEEEARRILDGRDKS